MKSGRKYLTIRKFSELTHTTVDTLKHYDEIGLLTPAYIGENKYRYYLPGAISDTDAHSLRQTCRHPAEGDPEFYSQRPSYGRYTEV